MQLRPPITTCLATLLATACGGGGGGGAQLDAANAGDAAHDGDSAADAPLPAGPRLAFASNRGGDYDIYLANLDGTGVTPFATGSGDDLFPAWSPDGARLAYASRGAAGFHLRIIDAATGHASDLDIGASAIDPTAPAFSPDGSTLAFGGGDQRIYTVPIAGGSATPLTDGSDRNSSPVWAPDGSVIYFSTDRSGTFDVWSVHPDGTTLTQVTTDTHLIGGPAISPDGATLALATPDPAILLWTVATGASRTVSTMPDAEPAFSRDGTHLAVTSTRFGGNNPELVLLDLAGGSAVRLTDDPAIDGEATFQPVP